MIPPDGPAAVNTGMMGQFRAAGWNLNRVMPIPDGSFGARFDTGRGREVTIFVSEATYDGQPHAWLHASVSVRDGSMPTYVDLQVLHRAVFGRKRYAYQVFAPADKHVNLTENVLHLFGRVDGVNALPDFAPFGSI